MTRSLRNFIRHPADIPIEIVAQGISGGIHYGGEHERVRDIGLGGLAVQCSGCLPEGSSVRLRIALFDPPFEVQGRVVWCRPEGDYQLLGVRFDDPGDLYRMRMIEQLCHIEHYRRELREREGRELSAEEAAREWAERFAAQFPGPPAGRGEGA